MDADHPSAPPVGERSRTVAQPSRRSLRGAVAWVALVTGCVVAPEERRLEDVLDVPEAWSASEDALAGEPFEAGLWWRDFERPELDALVEEALAHNHDLAAAAARVDAAAAQADVAGAGRRPTLNLGYDISRQRQNFVGFPIGGGQEVLSTQFTSQGLALNVAWEPDLWGRLEASEHAALAEVSASEADLRGARLSLAAQTTKAWLGVVEARLQLDLAREVEASYRSNTTFVRERYREGRADPLDLRLLESDLASAQASIELRRQALSRVQRQLELLLGRYPAGSIDAAADLPSMPADVPAGLPSELLRRRPDLAAAELRLLASDRRLAAARAELYPSFSLTGSAGRRSVDLEDLFDSAFDVWSLAASVLQPLYAGGRIQAGIDLADAEVRAQLQGYAQSVLRAFGEVEDSLVSEAMLEQREASLRAASEQAVHAQDMAEDRYQSGLVDVITVLTAQRRAVDARSRLLQVRRERLDNRVDLHLALGGNFDGARTHEAPDGDSAEPDQSTDERP